MPILPGRIAKGSGLMGTDPGRNQNSWAGDEGAAIMSKNMINTYVFNIVVDLIGWKN